MKTVVQHIVITPGTSGGKPRIAGRRITVQNIAIWHERMGLGADVIAAEYDLTLGEVYAALAYYFDHRSQIDADIRRDKSFVEALRRKIPSILRKKLGERGSDGQKD